MNRPPCKRTQYLGVNHKLELQHPWPLPVDERGQWPTRGRGVWPAKWIAIPDARLRNLVALYRLRFAMPSRRAARVFSSGDERYELWLDGVRIGRGPERGDPSNWYYDACDLDLDAGEHVLVARVWSQGVMLAPWSQVGLRHGFLLAAADDELKDTLNTGRAPWEGMRVQAYRFVGGTKGGWLSDEHVDGANFPWGFERGGGEGWGKVTSDERACTLGVADAIHTFEHHLRPGHLPPQRSEMKSLDAVRTLDAAAEWTAPFSAPSGEAVLAPWRVLAGGEAVTVPARSTVRILFDLETYRCAYLHACLSGGAGSVLRMTITESLLLPGKGVESKGHRREFAGRCCLTAPVQWTLDGGTRRHVESLWWRGGDFVLVQIVTADEPLTVEGLWIEETGYNWSPNEGSFECDLPRLERLMPICERTIHSCTHESYMDCPYYEQQLWVGDMRTQVLSAYCMHADSRLTERCLEWLADTRWQTGAILGRYPAPQKLSIPSFALWWVVMVHELAWWRGRRERVRGMMPAVRQTLDFMLRHQREDGAALTPFGWNYTDWAKDWEMGNPPESTPGPSSIHNRLLVLALRRSVALESWLGEPEMAARWRRRADEIAAASERLFWDEGRGLYADAVSHRTFSEHAQVIALLGGGLPEERRARLASVLPGLEGVTRTNLFWDHCVLEAFGLTGAGDALLARLEPYYSFAEQGLTTTPEGFGGTRSDCHAWSAHPRYHACATIAGVQPADWGFARVRIAPLLGQLQWVRAKIPHPAGTIEVALERKGSGLAAEVALPEGVEGVLAWRGEDIPLSSGKGSFLSRDYPA